MHSYDVDGCTTDESTRAIAESQLPGSPTTSQSRPIAGADDRRLQGGLHGPELIATLAKPSSGRILFDGVDITKKPGAMCRRLGITPRSAPLIAFAEWRDDGGTRCLRQPVRRSARAACRAIRLDRRTLIRPVGAEHAAVACLGTQHRLAVLALVEPLAGVGRHGFLLRVAALRAGEDRLKNDLGHVTEPASQTTETPRRPSPETAPRAKFSRDRTRPLRA